MPLILSSKKALMIVKFLMNLTIIKIRRTPVLQILWRTHLKIKLTREEALRRYQEQLLQERVQITPATLLTPQKEDVQST